MKIDYALLTDLYQLTMAQGYWETGQGDTQACFHMYFRDYPFKGGYAIACGMAQLADLVDEFSFSDEDVAYLGSLDAPGGRITGTSDALNTKGLLDLMLAQNPDTKTVGLLYSKSEDSSKQPIEDAKAYLEGKGIRCVEKTGTTTDEVTSAVDALIAEKVDAVFTPTDNTIMTAELAIYEKFLNAKIPQYCGADSFALNGAFVGYGVDYTKLGTITADMVVQVLVDGKDPATLPVTTFDNGIAMINTESCAALGYDLTAVKQAFDGKCSSVLETTTQQNFD